MRDKSRAYYERCWREMRVEAKHLNDIHVGARLIAHNIDGLYLPAQRKTGVPWPMFALTHYREFACNPDGQILNGQNWRVRTTKVPRGIGPFQSWEDAALEAAASSDKQRPWRQGWVDIRKWDIPTMLYELEKHNGFGYAGRDADSPYLWNFTHIGWFDGKYVADGVYDPAAKDKQCGVAPILKSLIDWGKWSP